MKGWMEGMNEEGVIVGYWGLRGTGNATTLGSSPLQTSWNTVRSHSLQQIASEARNREIG